MLFSEDVWDSIADIYEKTLNHKFIVELASGELPIEKFGYYIGQDLMYLSSYSRVLGIASVKTSNPSDQALLLKQSEYAAFGETELHRYYLDKYSISLPDRLSPAAFAYTNYLLSISMLEPLSVIVAALFPCAIIYAEIGATLSKNIKSEGNIYAPWIKEYSNPSFMDGAIAIRDLANRLAASSSDEDIAKMKEAFIWSARLEYLFWDNAYELREWKI